MALWDWKISPIQAFVSQRRQHVGTTCFVPAFRAGYSYRCLSWPSVALWQAELCMFPPIQAFIPQRRQHDTICFPRFARDILVLFLSSLPLPGGTPNIDFLSHSSDQACNFKGRLHDRSHTLPASLRAGFSFFLLSWHSAALWQAEHSFRLPVLRTDFLPA